MSVARLDKSQGCIWCNNLGKVECGFIRCDSPLGNKGAAQSIIFEEAQITKNTVVAFKTTYINN